MKFFIKNTIKYHLDPIKSSSNRFIKPYCDLNQREMEEEVLDNMETEKERGITITAQSVGVALEQEFGIFPNLDQKTLEK